MAFQFSFSGDTTYIYNPREGGGKVPPSSLTAQQVRRCSHRLINSVFTYISSIVRFDSAMGHIAVARIHNPKGFVRPLNGVFFIVACRSTRGRAIVFMIFAM